MERRKRSIPGSDFAAVFPPWNRKGPFTREARTLKPWYALLEWGDPEKELHPARPPGRVAVDAELLYKTDPPTAVALDRTFR
jgi:hypothetical protein